MNKKSIIIGMFSTVLVSALLVGYMAEPVTFERSNYKVIVSNEVANILPENELSDAIELILSSTDLTRGFSPYCIKTFCSVSTQLIIKAKLLPSDVKFQKVMVGGDLILYVNLAYFDQATLLNASQEIFQQGIDFPDVS